MNRWAERHATALRADLEPGEQLMAAERVVLSKSKTRTYEVRHWWKDYQPVQPDGSVFPIPGGIFVLGVSNERLLFWRASKGMAKPVELAGGLPLSEVAAVRVVRRLWIKRIAVLLEAGPLLVAKPLWGRGVHDVASAFAEARISTT